MTAILPNYTYLITGLSSEKEIRCVRTRKSEERHRLTQKKDGD